MGRRACKAIGAAMLVGIPLVYGGATFGATARDAATPPANVRTIVGQAVKVTRGTLRPGTRVKQRELGKRVFVDARHGFALADTRQATYAAATSDGGRTWRTSSPALVVHAAQAPLEVSEIGADSARLYYASGAEAVDVTADRGKHWYRALLPGAVLAVFSRGPGPGLAALVEGAAGPRPNDWIYVSHDGGRHWRYEPGL